MNAVSSLPVQAVRNDGCALVPWRGYTMTLSDGDEFSDFFSVGNEVCNGNARAVISSLGASSVVLREAANNPGKLYQLVEGGVTPVDGSGGLVRGVVWRSAPDGKGVKEMAKFAEVSQTAKLAATFFAQGMLIYIASELNAMKKQISEIQNELFESEVSRMKGCVRFAGTALRHYRRNGNKELLFNAIQSVETEIDPLLDAIMRQVRRMPSTTSVFGQNKEELKHSYDEAISATMWLLRGMVALAVLYSVTDPEFGKGELNRLLKDFLSNREIVEWLQRAGKTLTQKGFDEKLSTRIGSMVKSLNEQNRVLAAPSCGVLLTGRQLVELQYHEKAESDVGVRLAEPVQA